MSRWSWVLLLSVAITSLSVPAASAQGTDTSDEEARALFSAGRLAYEAGDYAHALEDFTRAYERSPRPELLFNIGQAADRLRRDEEALDAYRRFLEGVPDSPNRHLVETRIAFLQGQVTTTSDVSDTPRVETRDAPVAPDVATTPPATPTQEPSQAMHPVGPIVLAIGGASLIAGAVLVGLGYADRASVEHAPDGSSWSAVEGAYGRADTEATTGFVLLGLGAALAATGAVLTATVVETHDVRVAASPGGFVVRGAF